jgi:formylmethanofuran dehydrogenase subunit E
MEPDDLGKFYDLLDQQLLHILAFRMSEYVQEARDVLLAVMHDRGYTDTDIQDYRDLYLRRRSLSVKCENCGIELQLEHKDLEAGVFSCPACSTQQVVTYPHDAYYSEPELNVASMPEEVVEVEEEAILDETQEEEPIVENIEPEPDPDIPLGSSGVTCLQCNKELGKDDVFVSNGEFYCKLCYDAILSSSPPTDSDANEDQ